MYSCYSRGASDIEATWPVVGRGSSEPSGQPTITTSSRMRTWHCARLLCDYVIMLL